jgi:dTDP-4-amino-4,6-dideoxygalactose transaminase
MSTMNIQMVDLITQYNKIKPEIDDAIHRVLDSGHYILGKEVGEFEASAAKYLGTRHAIGCASGTDALQVAMMALGIGAGDEVLTTPFTFVATTETIVLLGAKPVYVDIDPRTFNLDPSKVEAAITPRTKAIIPVHLYGQSVDMDPLMAVARRRNLPVIEDMCQAIGADYRGVKVGGIGTMGCISFFPSKNLGAFGDAGMIVTNDGALAANLRMIVAHGSRVRYKHEVVGVNSRLDALQAAILGVKLKHLPQWTEARRTRANLYNRYLAGTGLVTPAETNNEKAVYHLYVVRTEAGRRGALQNHLQSNGISTGIHYPIALPNLKAYRYLNHADGDFPEATKASSEIVSLPMYPELEEEEIRYIAERIARFFAGEQQ